MYAKPVNIFYIYLYYTYLESVQSVANRRPHLAPFNLLPIIFVSESTVVLRVQLSSGILISST